MGTDWVTIKVPESDREQADDYKPDGVTWGDCLVAGAERLADDLESDTRRFEPETATADVEELAAEIRQELGFGGDPEKLADVDALAEAVADRIEIHEGSLSTIEERTGRIERTLEDLTR